MSKKYKSAKITTKDGKESKYVNLYPITEVGIPRKALDPKIWEIPEGFYALEISDEKESNEPCIAIIKRKIPTTNEINEVDVYLYKINDIIDEVPEYSLDSEIWDIPTGYFALESIPPIRIYKSVRLKLREEHNSSNLSKFRYSVLYYILPGAGIPRKALDPKIWEIPKGFYAMEPKPYIGHAYLKNPRKFNKHIFEDPAPPFNPIIVTFYPIKEGEEIPKETLDPETWNIPIGYYAIDKLDPNIKSYRLF